MKFELKIKSKKLTFNSEIRGLKLNGKYFISGKDGKLIYDQTVGFKAGEIELQMSTNTSTLIPAFRILAIRYNKYFDQKEVVNSQNNIIFYWGKSRLAAYYNRFSTDDVPYEKREAVIKKAVTFLIKSKNKLPLKEEFLKKVLEPVKLLGFYHGFPIFDDNFGFAKLKCLLGIHVGNVNVMISTPLDKYEEDIYELSTFISKKVNQKYFKKKNRVTFERTKKIIKLLGI